jgi:hypothetical protein
MKPTCFLGVLLVILTVCPSAWAFRISGHDWITHQAVNEFNHCFPGSLSQGEETILTLTDAEEDANLIRKWIRYSHFYNPDKKIDLGHRVDSSVRIADIEELLSSETQLGEHGTFKILAALGHALHHLQDMASPPHVVPVMHDLSDLFEKHELDGQTLDYFATPLMDDCQAFAASADPGSFHDLLTQTARATLNSLDKARFSVTRDGTERALAEDSFWIGSDGTAFGRYGRLGNTFGLTHFSVDGSDYVVAPDVYTHIWERQLALAVHASKRALYRALVMRAL